MASSFLFYQLLFSTHGDEEVMLVVAMVRLGGRGVYLESENVHVDSQWTMTVT